MPTLRHGPSQDFPEGLGVLTLALFKTTVHPYAAHVEIRRAAAAAVPVWVFTARVALAGQPNYVGEVARGFIARGLSDGHTRDRMAEEGRAGALAQDYLEGVGSWGHGKAYPAAIVGIESVAPSPGLASKLGRIRENIEGRPQPTAQGETSGEGQLLIHEVVEALVLPMQARLIACGRRERDRVEFERYGLSPMAWDRETYTLLGTTHGTRKAPKRGTVRAWLHGLGACGEYTKVE